MNGIRDHCRESHNAGAGIDEGSHPFVKLISREALVSAADQSAEKEASPPERRRAFPE